ncbi:ABC transporter permease [Candidatus Saccharibacteria bacterium]|nr:ABC transporter permease [Candidatus Saccharibacteria bacterium]
MFKAALKSLRTHKLRMALTGFAVVLGVSFVAGTYMFTDSISSTFDGLFGNVYAGIDVTVRPAKGELGQVSTSFDESVLQTVKQTEGVGVAEPGVGGLAQPLDKNGKPVGGQGAPSLGFSWTKDESMNSLKIHDGDGRAPENSGEMVVDKATADKYEFKIGDKITVLFDCSIPQADFTLVGIATFGSANSLAGANLSAFNLADAQKYFDMIGKYSSIDIKASDGYNKDKLLANIKAALPEGLEAVTGEQQTNEQLDEINQNLGFLNTALLVFAGIAIFVGSFIIQNTFRIVVTQRTRELALLRALGATRNQVMRLVLYEAFFVGLVAGALGIFAGAGIAYGVRGMMNALGFSLPGGPLEIAPRTVIISLIVGSGVTVVSSLLPAIKASRLAPVAALRDNQAPTKRKSLVTRGLIGAVLILIGGGAIVYGLGENRSNPLPIVGFGVATQFIGVSMTAPLLALPISRFFGIILAKLRGIPAKLAYRNAIRTPRRTASTASALMIGVSLIAMIAIIASTFRVAIDKIVNDSFAADIIVTSNNVGEGGPNTGTFSEEAYNRIKGLKELKDVSALRYAFTGYKVDGASSSFVLAGINPTNFDSTVARLKPSEGTFERLKIGTVAVRQQELDKRGLQIGDTVDIEYAETGLKTYLIVGSFEDAFDSDYLISADDYMQNFSNHNLVMIAATYNDSYSAETIKQAVEGALSEFPQLSVQDQSDLKRTANEQVDQLIALLWSLLAMAVIIAVFGITNTLMLSIAERTREIGMLRAIGMTRKQVRRMIRMEAIIIALFGALLGISVGSFFAWVILRALESEGISGYVFPVVQMIIYFIFAVIAGIFAALLPARKAARMDVLKAIYTE